MSLSSFVTSLKKNRPFLSSIFNIPEDSVVYFTKCLKLTKIYNFLRIHNKTKKTSTGGKGGGEQGEQGSRGRRGAGGAGGAGGEEEKRRRGEEEQGE